MNSTQDDAVLEQLRAYLDDVETHDRAWAVAREPHPQEVRVPGAWWRSFAQEQTLPAPVREGVLQAIERIEEKGDLVDRTLLTELADQADESTASLVRCWFTVMCWGAGPQNRFRLRQWTRALPSRGFTETLARSSALLADADPSGAYLASKLPGVGESYLTKWLWALGLTGRIEDPHPYILDRYVWQSIRRLGWSPTGRNSADRWVDYCRALDRWALKLSEADPPWQGDGDRIEQLLFDRKPGEHLYRWLGS